YLADMPLDHPFIKRYQQNKGILCVGQGDWEIPESTREMARICEAKSIPLWVDFWGYDVKHDWDWWFKQVDYFLPFLLDNRA
ncbi:MAG: esterase, partial [Oscillospiraceae bacterium]|nr:esterase [Oscillospiraceae bacterium]